VSDALTRTGRGVELVEEFKEGHALGYQKSMAMGKGKSETSDFPDQFILFIITLCYSGLFMGNSIGGPRK
jgi:hypothetical protein